MIEIPVYLFTGFLESGKTSFIQDALEGDDFNAGERTLLLLCEEGVEEYDTERFNRPNVFIEVIERESDLTPSHLEALQKKHDVERVIIEYNGMWSLDSIYATMPEAWLAYQETMFADATTFLSYNQNMRQLVFDKLKSAELVVFNRCKRDGSMDKMEFHKIVRAANRRSQILYEYAKDDVEVDDIEDPLPFDVEADSFTVGDDAFAEWYRDINEEQNKYDGKIITIKGRCVTGGELPDDKFIFGRHVMTCCVEDIQFAGLACKWENAASTLEHGGWVTITAEIKIEYDEIYGEEGPVLHCMKVEKSEEAHPEVAQF